MTVTDWKKKTLKSNYATSDINTRLCASTMHFK